MSSTMSRRQMHLMHRRRQPGQLLWVLLGILLLLYIINSPYEAADSAQQLMGLLQNAANAFFSFLRELGQPGG